ncbi:hypothetical protein [Streptococcus sp. X13SY08]|uniref:hypothetical protein n=1 Tax=Streptococcus sp. X13SY08 TaxID=1676616 RepID=UPI001F412690|nr:hypothetical protein [Streptococcus sp. X13SY08]
MNYAQTYLMANMSSFPSEQIPIIQRELEQLDEQAAARFDGDGCQKSYGSPIVGSIFGRIWC